MFYAAFNDAQGERRAYIYNSWEVYHNDTFSPDCKELYLVEFKATGKTYAERKESVRNVAIDFYEADSEVSGGLSYGEWSIIDEWFERMGKRYGLLTEFRENAIC